MKTVVAVARWETVPGESIEAYWERLREAGLDPLDLGEPGQGPSTGSGHSLADCAGLVLTGGVDIDPARYGESPHERVRRTDPRRDEFEAGLLEAALAADLPVLAICRGHQLLNVALGGSLHQHIEGGAHAADYRSDGAPSRSHAVELAEGSRLRAWLGADALSVNSRHHQAVTPERLAPGLQVAALSPDGLVEAVESSRHAWVIGVQWHPERQEPAIPGFAAASARLFAAFARAVRERP